MQACPPVEEEADVREVPFLLWSVLRPVLRTPQLSLSTDLLHLSALEGVVLAEAKWQGDDCQDRIARCGRRMIVESHVRWLGAMEVEEAFPQRTKQVN